MTVVAWSDRFSRRGRRFASAHLSVGRLWFGLDFTPSRGWEYVVAVRPVQVKVSW